jgi:hypothetical protein
LLDAASPRHEITASHQSSFPSHLLALTYRIRTGPDH